MIEKSKDIDPDIGSLLHKLLNSGAKTLDDASIDKVLDYLDRHKKLLDDSVYPHLRTQIESMKKGT
jgi:hypothetical protein